MKKKIIITCVLILVVIILLVSMYFYSFTRVSKNSEKVIFTVDSGATTKEVINKLYEANLIKSKIATTIYVKLHKDIVIKAGTYELDRVYDTRTILKTLSGDNAIKNTITVRFSEGKRITDFVKIISDNFDYSEDEIYSVINDKEYLKELINKYDFLSNDILNSDIYYPLEGYLFPDTYEFYKDASIKTIIEKMLDKLKNVLDNNKASLSDKSIHEILTIASIIENEAVLDGDRSIVSQVIYKRLGINMSLGMDVTTYYGVKKALGEVLTPSDLKSKNAYNTRRTDFLGLPVGPISNPGLKSINAALNPSDTDYLYFYAEITTGKLHFARTYSEFQSLIKKYS